MPKNPDTVRRAEVNNKHIKSTEALEKAKSLMPAGSPGGLPARNSIERSEGCYLWDADGNKLLDLFNGDWLLPTGFGNPQIKSAIQAQLEKGTTFGSPDASLAYEMAKAITERLPSIKRIRFSTSGTDANQAAIRLARMYTGRDKIAKMMGGYHGTYDPVIVRNNYPPDPNYTPEGLAPGTFDEVVLLPFNDPDTAEVILESEAENLAAVILEPMMGLYGFLPATKEYLERLRAVTERHGIVMILDEVVTFPVDFHGAQGYYGITPDMTTMGKSIGGGLPLSAYGGRSEIMDLLDPDLHNGQPPALIPSTTGGIPICLAAGLAQIRQLTPEAHKKLWELGDYMRSGIENMAAKHQIPLQATGLSHFVGIHWGEEKVVDHNTYLASDRTVIGSIGTSFANAGIHGPLQLPVLSLAWEKHNVDFVLDALENALREHGYVK